MLQICCKTAQKAVTFERKLPRDHKKRDFPMMTHLVRRYVYVCLLIAAAIGLGAWFQAESAPDLYAPTVRVSTHLVLVDVVVTDKQGKPITGLKAEDFSIQEKGKAQKVAFVEPPKGIGSIAPPAVAPGIYSNRPEFRSPGGPLTLILLDAANTPFKDQAYARVQMLKYVKEQLKPGQRVGVFTLTTQLGVLQDFTSDPQVLQKALEQYKPQEQELGKAVTPPITTALGSPDVGAAGIAAAINAVRDFQGAQIAYVMERRTESTLLAMRSLARILGGIPGRKNVIWITAGFPFSLIPDDRAISEAELAESLPSVKQLGVGTRSAGSGAETARTAHAPEIREAAAQLANSQVVIYPVDARGLASGMEFTSDDSANRQLDSMGERAQVRMSDMTASQETMRELARETGGKAYVNQNEIKDGVALADSDNAASYTIGYYPDDKKWDGKYRSIKVKVARDGVETRHRRGYFAMDPTQVKDRKVEAEVAEAVRDRVPDTLITFLAAVRPPENGKLKVIFQVDTNTVSAEDGGNGAKKMNVEFYATLFDSAGKMLSTKGTKVNQTFTADVFQQIQQKGMQVGLELDAPSGKDNEVRLLVRDNRTGYVGSLMAKVL